MESEKQPQKLILCPNCFGDVQGVERAAGNVTGKKVLSSKGFARGSMVCNFCERPLEPGDECFAVTFLAPDEIYSEWESEFVSDDKNSRLEEPMDEVIPQSDVNLPQTPPTENDSNVAQLVGFVVKDGNGLYFFPITLNGFYKLGIETMEEVRNDNVEEN